MQGFGTLAIYHIYPHISTYIHIYVGCFTQIHEVNVKMLHYIFRLGKQIYKSNL